MSFDLDLAPQIAASHDSELDLLAKLLMQPGLLGDIQPHIRDPKVFYYQPHRRIWEGIQAVTAENRPADFANVTAWLESRQLLETAVNRSLIRDMFSAATSPSDPLHLAEYLKDLYERRRIGEVGGLLQRLSADVRMPLPEVRQRAEQAVYDCTQTDELGEIEPLSEILVRCWAEYEQRIAGEAPAQIPTGLYDLDAMLGGGLRIGTLTTIMGRPAMGKCLGLGTPVLMYDGTIKAVEDICVGDQIMGPDSRPRNVLSLARGREQMYWVKQSKGMDYRVNESHILSLRASGTEGSRKHGQIVNISIKDYLSKSRKFQIRHKGYKARVDWPRRDVLVDPYLLGVWLGDGSSAKPAITNPDIEIEDQIRSIAEKDGYAIRLASPKERCKEIHLLTGARCFVSDLRSLGVLGDKHIPHQYLANDEQTRLSLLAGILDTDGHYLPKTQNFEITQKSHALAAQIKRLAESLGFHITTRVKEGTIKSSGFSGLYHRMFIGGDLERIPTKVQRKQARPTRMNRSWLCTQIRVEPDCVDDYYGFEIDGDHLFLLGDCTVTHNTAALLTLACKMAAEVGVAIFSLEMSKQQLMERLIVRSGIPRDKWQQGIPLSDRESERLVQVMQQMETLRAGIDDSSTPTVVEMGQKLRRMIARHQARNLPPVRVVFVDYLQLLCPGNGPQAIDALSRTTKALCALAKDLGVAIVLLSQVNRSKESMGDKRPTLSDARGSGTTEEDSAVVVGLYREAYYNPQYGPEAEWILLKNRFGPTGTVKLLYEGSRMEFLNIERSAS